MTSRRSAALAAWLVLGSWCTQGVDAQQPATLADETTYRVTVPDGVPEIPFELINNHLILQLSVNGSAPLAVALDTGMPAPGLALYQSETVEGLGLEIDPSIRARVGGAGGDGKRLEASIALSESIALAGLEVDGTRVIVMPKLHNFMNYHQGILGHTLFGRFVVEIDYDRRRVRLHEPSSYTLPAGAQVLPLTFRHNVPYARVRVTPVGGAPFDAEVVVDLGASHAISLNTDASERITIPAGSLQTLLGRGVSGEIWGQVGRIAALQLGDAVLEDVVTSFPVSEHQNPRGVDSLAGNLGSDVLRRFKTVFDYAGKRMILVPNDDFREPFVYDRSGLRFGYSGELVVEGVLGGSPAEDLGVRVDDLLTHVDGEPVAGGDLFSVRERLKGSGEVRLSFRRGDETLERTLTLRTLI